MQISGTERLERVIRVAARRVSLAITAGACIIGGAFTASSDLASWVPLTLGAFGGVVTVILIADLVTHRGHRS